MVTTVEHSFAARNGGEKPSPQHPVLILFGHVLSSLFLLVGAMVDIIRSTFHDGTVLLPVMMIREEKKSGASSSNNSATTYDTTFFDVATISPSPSVTEVREGAGHEEKSDPLAGDATRSSSESPAPSRW